MSACPLVVLACESLHVCTVCIWRCEHARFCVEVFYALYINFHSFIHSWPLANFDRDGFHLRREGNGVCGKKGVNRYLMFTFLAVPS